MAFFGEVSGMGRHERVFSRLDLAAVAVVIAVLVATVAPQLLRISGPANASVVKGAMDRLASGVALAHALWLGRDPGDSTAVVQLGHRRVDMNKKGWPRARTALDCSNNIWALALDGTFVAGVPRGPGNGTYRAALVDGMCVYDYGGSSDFRISYDPRNGMVAMQSQ